MASDRNDTGLVLFLTGLTLGAIAGVLLAPASGAETRRKIVDTARSLRDEAEEEFEEGLEHLKHDIPAKKERYSEAVREGWKAFRATLEKDRIPSVPPGA
ncbi:MAG: YtxH domain-containing protein [Nitrospiraceae bacterium]|nr:YtxH domain-containing protein [Nitrospiraceae bacterium]